MKGFIQLHKQLKDWEWYTDLGAKTIFLHCLLSANYKDRQWRGEIIKKGSFVTGRKALSVETGLTEQQVRTALKKLESTNEITIRSTSNFSVITVVKWADYQEKPQEPTKVKPSEQPRNNQRINQRNNQRITTTNQGNNINKYNPPIVPPIQENRGGKSKHPDELWKLFLRFWEWFPRQRRGNRDKAWQAWCKAINEQRATEQEIIDGVQRYANSREVREGYAKGAAAWLNDDRWSSDYSDKQSGGIASGFDQAFSEIERGFSDGGSVSAQDAGYGDDGAKAGYSNCIDGTATEIHPSHQGSPEIAYF